MSSKRETRTKTDMRVDYCVFLASSKSGNPRARVHFTDGTSATTEVDGQVGYGIDNRDYREGPCTVTFDARTGAIIGIRRSDQGKDDRATGVTETR